MEELFSFLANEGIDPSLIDAARRFRDTHPVAEEDRSRIPVPEYFYYGRKTWELALAALVGTDTYNGQAVVFRPGPIWLCAEKGGFGILDEINMAKNEALAVLHAALDFRRSLDVPGYERIDLREETRFIATMNYGYAGTRDLNEALTSRFAVLDMPVIAGEDLSKLIARRYPSIDGKICSQLVRLYEELEKKAESAEISDSALDLRGLLDAVALMEQGLTSGDALDMCVVNKSFDAYERSLIRDVIAARLPSDLTRDVVFGA